MIHISDHDLECFHLGIANTDAELATIEEHQLRCSDRIDAAERMPGTPLKVAVPA
jgi:hypothetical protein